MGAATTMMTSGEVLPEYIRCFVEDCGYTSVWEQFKKELKEQFNLPAFPLLYTASWICELQNGWNFHEASAIEHDFVPTYMVNEVFAAKSEPKEIWLVPDTDHATSYKNYPEEYTKRVKAFTDKYIY